MTRKFWITSNLLAENFGMMSVEEVALLKSCASKLTYQSIVVNIGANVGTSALAILEVTEKSTIFSIDIKPCPEERENIINSGHTAYSVIRILGDSTRVVLGWNPKIEIDLLFVDGNHSEEALRRDFEWVNFVRKGGFVLFHDYDHPNLPYMKPVILEFMKDHQLLGTERFLIAFQKA